MSAKRLGLLLLGWCALLLGCIGILVPILPTTPFVLLTAACFSFSSPRMYEMLRRNRFFGPYVEHYRAKTGISVREKWRGVAVLWILLLISMLAMRTLWLTVLLCAVGAAVTTHILLLRTRESP